MLQLWKRLTPALFGRHPITFRRALGILVLCRILFGGHGSYRSGFRRRMADGMADRWGRMTKEERGRFRQGPRGRWLRTRGLFRRKQGRRMSPIAFMETVAQVLDEESVPTATGCAGETPAMWTSYRRQSKIISAHALIGRGFCRRHHVLRVRRNLWKNGISKPIMYRICSGSGNAFLRARQDAAWFMGSFYMTPTKRSNRRLVSIDKIS